MTMLHGSWCAPQNARPTATERGHKAPLLQACLLVCLLVSLLLLSAAPARADSMEEETIELVKLVKYDPNQAVRDGERLLGSALQSGDAPGQLRAWRLLALAHDELMDMVALRKDVAHGEVLARRLGHVEAQCQFIAAAGVLERTAGRYAESNAFYDQAIALAAHHHRERTLASLYFSKATTSLDQGRVSEAMSLLVKAHGMFEAQHDRIGMARALSAMGVGSANSLSGPDQERAIGYYLQALELLDAKVNRATVLTIYYNLGMAYYRAKDATRARRYFQQGLDMALEIEGPVGAAYYDLQLSKIERDEKHYSVALDRLDRALQAFTNRGDLPTMVFNATLTRADMLSLLGRVNESMQALESARTFLPQLNTPMWDARFHETAGHIQGRLGRYEHAYRELSEFVVAERRRTEALNRNHADELKTRFEVHQKESENVLLRAQQHEAAARRMTLFLALSLSVVMLGVLAFYLVYQIRRSRRFAALAMRDELTGMPNRRSITEYARLQWAARAAHDGKFRVAILDIDHFKRVNDDFGHDVGDAVLVAFSQACAGKLRSSDRLGRYGGEEFLLIMPGADATQVSIVFDRLQQAVQNLAVAGLPADRRLTFSMGVAEAFGGSDSLAEVIHRADEALYRAKQNGRNRCETAAHVRLAGGTAPPRAAQTGSDRLLSR